MNPGLEWILIIGAGLVAGFLASAVWKAVVALAGITVVLLAISLAWGDVRGLTPAMPLALQGGQLSQLVAVAYMCALAAVIAAVRTGLRADHAT